MVASTMAYSISGRSEQASKKEAARQDMKQESADELPISRLQAVILFTLAGQREELLPLLPCPNMGGLTMKEIACGDIVPGCDFKASAETEDQLLKKVAVHAKEAHGIDVTPELAAQVKSKIRNR